MSNAVPKPLTDHSLARGLKLVWLCLLRMLGNLRAGQSPARAHLTLFARFIASVLIIRAARSLPPRPRCRPRPCNTPPGMRRRLLAVAPRRAAIGSVLRRRLRARDGLAHVAALIRAILHLDQLTAELARRLSRRLTRLSPLVLACARAQAITAWPALRPSAADTS